MAAEEIPVAVEMDTKCLRCDNDAAMFCHRCSAVYCGPCFATNAFECRKCMKTFCRRCGYASICHGCYCILHRSCVLRCVAHCGLCDLHPNECKHTLHGAPYYCWGVWCESCYASKKAQCVQNIVNCKHDCTKACKTKQRLGLLTCLVSPTKVDAAKK